MNESGLLGGFWDQDSDPNSADGKNSELFRFYSEILLSTQQTIAEAVLKSKGIYTAPREALRMWLSRKSVDRPKDLQPDVYIPPQSLCG